MKKFAKHIAAGVFALGACLPMATSFAAEASKFGIIDIRMIIEQSETAQQVAERLQAEFKDQETALEAAESRFIEKRDTLARDRAIMTEAQIQGMEKDLASAQRDLQRLQVQFSEEFNVRQRDEMQELMVSLKRVIDQYAAEQSFDLIFPSDMSLYFAKPVDITDEVMGRLDKNV